MGLFMLYFNIMNKNNSILDFMPKNISAIAKAIKLQKKVSLVGFDWKNEKDVLLKIKEEIAELEKELIKKDNKKISEELGDIIFSIINLARFLKLDPEKILNKTNDKFISRFKKMELYFKDQGKNIKKLSLEDMEKVWIKLKKLNN